MKNREGLLKELFQNISTTGAISFSSKALVDKMLSHADFRGVKLIVELGGGDGSITRGIVERMDDDAELLVFEISRNFCDNLEKEFLQPNVRIICDSAENLHSYLQNRKAGLILSSLPFSLISKEVRDSIYRQSKDGLAAKGLFIQICYSYLLKFQFKKYFKTIRSSIMLKNFPPTFIMVCN
jgi:phospholipid N-methyltransferase